MSSRYGVLARRGHTEGTVDLMQMAGLQPAGVLCELTNPDGTMAKTPEIIAFGKHWLAENKRQRERRSLKPQPFWNTTIRFFFFPIVRDFLQLLISVLRHLLSAHRQLNLLFVTVLGEIVPKNQRGNATA